MLERIAKGCNADPIRIGDNGVVYIPTGLVHQDELRRTVQDAIQRLNPQIVAHVAFQIAADAANDHVIAFRITLRDAASRIETLSQVTGDVAATLLDIVRPIENWGLPAYFSFRSESEQKKLDDPEWV